MGTITRRHNAYEFAGSEDALYERHLAFDNIVDLAAIDARERFEAFAHAVRDVLSRRWLETKDTYTRREPEARLLPLDGVSDRPLARQ